MALADASPKTLSNHLPERSHDNKREVRAPAMPSADILRSLTHQARRSGSGAPPRARRNPKVALPSKLPRSRGTPRRRISRGDVWSPS